MRKINALIVSYLLTGRLSRSMLIAPLLMLLQLLSGCAHDQDIYEKTDYSSSLRCHPEIASKLIFKRIDPDKTVVMILTWTKIPQEVRGKPGEFLHYADGTQVVFFRVKSVSVKNQTAAIEYMVKMGGKSI